MLIPSIDLSCGRIVQLVQGERLALESDDLEGWIARFSGFAKVQLIDLDAAKADGRNGALVGRIAAALPASQATDIFRFVAIGDVDVAMGNAASIVDLEHTLGVFQKDALPQLVRIRFAPEVARYVHEHRWSATQTLTPLKNGGLRLEVRLSQFEELQSWLLSFGSKAVVERPKQLRDQIRLELLRAAKQYEGPGVRGQGPGTGPGSKRGPYPDGSGPVWSSRRPTSRRCSGSSKGTLARSR